MTYTSSSFVIWQHVLISDEMPYPKEAALIPLLTVITEAFFYIGSLTANFRIIGTLQENWQQNYTKHEYFSITYKQLDNWFALPLFIKLKHFLNVSVW